MERIKQYAANHGQKVVIKNPVFLKRSWRHKQGKISVLCNESQAAWAITIVS